MHCVLSVGRKMVLFSIKTQFSMNYLSSHTMNQQHYDPGVGERNRPILQYMGSTTLPSIKVKPIHPANPIRTALSPKQLNKLLLPWVDFISPPSTQTQTQIPLPTATPSRLPKHEFKITAVGKPISLTHFIPQWWHHPQRSNSLTP